MSVDENLCDFEQGIVLHSRSETFTLHYSDPKFKFHLAILPAVKALWLSLFVSATQHILFVYREGARTRTSLTIITR